MSHGVLGLSLLLASCVTSAAGGPPDERLLQFRVGSRSMSDSTVWEGIDRPISLGFDYSSHGASTQFGPEYGMAIAGDAGGVNGHDASSFFYELYGGLRHTWDLGSEERFHPYVGVGLCGILAMADGAGLTLDDDASLGGYVHAGAYYRVGDRFCLGVDARAVVGTHAALLGVETDVDYYELALTFGWGF